MLRNPCPSKQESSNIDQRMKRPGRKIFSSLALCLGLLAFEDRGAFGQGRGGITADPLGPFASSIERRRAEQDLRSLPLKLRERRERNLSDPKALKQMNEDFVEIQTIRASMVKTFAAGGMIEPDILESSAADVKRRGSRLRSMLALSEETSDIEIKSESLSRETINDRAFRLCIEISRFTENPIFKANGVYSANHANEASKTLDAVVAMAGSIQKDAARLRKN